ncbi:hypothetical protein CSOJ01_00728 [Colletotrichum sojae]|uniref:Uncharacterized protein n=1 Tax=Colletotrichum sojae TaxID=2175907 RepID=A0A8H6N4V6_9PEZI|nr:hypothetical protein CSOJ01_00728 [Colletotrichum sojae]
MLVVGTARVMGVVDVGVVAARVQVSIPTPSRPGYAAYEERASSALMDHGAAAVLVADAAKLRSHGAHHERLHFFPFPSAPSASTRNAQASQTKSGSSSRWPSIHRSRRKAPHREWTGQAGGVALQYLPCRNRGRHPFRYARRITSPPFSKAKPRRWGGLEVKYGETGDWRPHCTPQEGESLEEKEAGAEPETGGPETD